MSQRERDVLKVMSGVLKGDRTQVAEGLWHRKRERNKHRSRREGRACFGELVQADASTHDWLEGRGVPMALVGMIDDATSGRSLRKEPTRKRVKRERLATGGSVKLRFAYPLAASCIPSRSHARTASHGRPSVRQLSSGEAPRAVRNARRAIPTTSFVQGSCWLRSQKPRTDGIVSSSSSTPRPTGLE